MLSLKARAALALPVCCMLANLLCAQPALTIIQDVLYKADGTKFNGILTINWNSFRAADTSNIPTHSVTSRVTNGYLRVSLVPTTNAASPAVYNVVYNSDGRIQFTETWVVPPSTSPLRVSDVRSSPAIGSAVALTQIQVADVAGLRTELNIRPSIGASFSPSRAAIIDASGGISAASGNLTDCIHVDGASGACGGSGASSPTAFIDAETPSGLVDGVNVAFQLANAPIPVSSLTLYRNGLALLRSVDFSMSGNTITFVTGNAPQPGDVLQAFYRMASSGSSGVSGSLSAGSGSSPSCSLYTVSNNGTHWTTAINSGPPVVGPAIASSNTQDVPILGLSARGTLTGIREKTTMAWSGSGFTSLGLSVGDSVGGVAFYTAPSYDLAAAVANTNFRNTQLFRSAADSGSNVLAHFTANGALNSAMMTGSVDIDICSVGLP